MNYLVNIGTSEEIDERETDPLRGSGNYRNQIREWDSPNT